VTAGVAVGENLVVVGMAVFEVDVFIDDMPGVDLILLRVLGTRI
jgi:hypothetical protein